MKIYIVVEVWFDYHRYQGNCFASSDKNKCEKWINENNENNLPIFRYSDKYDYDGDIDHYWIQEL